MPDSKKYFLPVLAFPILFFIFVIVNLLTCENPCFATGISSPNAMMVFSNLKIGQNYSLRQILGYPFSVTYSGNGIVGLNISLEKPVTSYNDYEPLTDLTWVKIEKTDFSLDPGQTAETDITISIPNDEKYLGKKYYVTVCPRTSAPQGITSQYMVFATGISCVLRLEIAGKPPTPEEIRQLRKRSIGGYLNVMVSPERIFVTDVPVGKNINLKKEYGEAVKIINSTDFNVIAMVESVPPKQFGIFPPEGYEETENANWLKVGKTKVKVEKNSIKEIPLDVKIPKDKIGKKYFFTVSVEVQSKVREVRNIIKVYVDTQAEKAAVGVSDKR